MSKMENIVKVTSPIPLKVKEARIKAMLKERVKTKERKVEIDTLKTITGGRTPAPPMTRDPMVATTTTPTTKDNNSLGKAKENGPLTIKARDVDEDGPVATFPATTQALTPMSTRSLPPRIPTLLLSHSGPTIHLSNGQRNSTTLALFS
jgi:hypothetical protein